MTSQDTPHENPHRNTDPDAHQYVVPGGRTPQRLGDMLGSVLRHLRVGDSAASTSVFAQWRSIVGDAIADHVTPRRLENRVLTVEVDEPAWATQLRFLEKDLVHTLRNTAGDIVDSLDIKVRRSR